MEAVVRPNDKLWELQGIITKMPLTVCCSTALPEFGLRWKEVSRAVRNCRLPMQPSSVARVLCRYLAKSMPPEELEEILARLRLKLVTIQPRTWHVLHLHEPTDSEPISDLLQAIPRRVLTALQRRNKRAARPEVQALVSGELVYLSVRFVSAVKDGAALYVAAAPGAPAALVSASAPDHVLKACVEGLGYSSYTRAGLHGPHAVSLLRVARGAWGSAADPEPYEPAPTLTATGIDYTHAAYDRTYVDSVIGPNPPLLTQLSIKTSCSFFDRSRLNKTINIALHLKTASVAATLRAWVLQGAIAADSELVRLVRRTRANVITYDKDASDSD